MARSGTKDGAALDAATTALSDYIKLEAVGRYQTSSDQPEIDVVVSFGARSLVLIGFDERAVAHWPLATLRGWPDGQGMALWPDDWATERVVLEDPEMISAIRTVCPELSPDRPKAQLRPRRLRWIPVLGTLVLIALVGGFFALPYFAERLAQTYPATSARTLDAALVGRLRQEPPLPVRICSWPDGKSALARVSARVAQGTQATITVLDRPDAEMLVLPGGRILLARGLFDLAATPEEIAALLAHGFTKVEMRAPIIRLMQAAAPWQIVGLYLSTTPEDEELAHMLAVLRTPRLSNDNGLLMANVFDRLGDSGLPSTAFASLAKTMDGADLAIRFGWDANTAKAARAADRVGGGPYEPALDDRGWLALQNICDESEPL